MKFSGWLKYNKFLDKNYVKLVYKFVFVALILSIPPALALIPMMYIPLPSSTGTFPHANTVVANQADILFVVDNSFSTEDYQGELDRRVINLISQLVGIDYRIAVTTSSTFCNGGRYLLSMPPNYNHPPTPSDFVFSDAGGGIGTNCAFDPPYNVSNSPNYWHIDGPLENYGGYIMDGLIMPLFNSPGFWVTNTTPNPQTVVGATIVEAGFKGAWSEQSIKAVYRAVERSQINDLNGYNTNNINFFRPSASFVVIMLSDATESGNLPENQAANLYNFVKTVWPTKNFYYHSIYNASWDLSCETLRGLLETCSTGQYTAITNLTNGIAGDIQNSNYTSYLSSMGTQIKNATKVIPLDCNPIGPVTITGPPNPTYSIVLNEIHFTGFLTPGTYTFNYNCSTP
jgi:hypothetical protein